MRNAEWSAEALLQAAGTAMYAAKQAGTRHELYVLERDRRGPERVARLGELRRALAEGELVTYFQPRWTSAPARSPAPRRSCAGNTRSAG